MRISRDRKNKNGGFTLLEMILALAVVSILAGIMIGMLGPYIDRAKTTLVESELRVVAIAAIAAQAETCAECDISVDTQLLYTKAGSSAEYRDQVFEKHLKSYIGKDAVWKNLQYVRIAGRHLTVIYEYNGRNYRYERSAAGSITITRE